MSEQPLTDLTRGYRLELNMGDSETPVWQTVFGMVEFTPAVEPTIQDDSDYESDGWKGNTKTAQGWPVEAKPSHRCSPVPNDCLPTHAALEDASEAFGADSYVHIRYYRRSGRGSGREGRALVTWAPDGGDHEQLDRVTVTLTGDGPLTQIENPAAGNGNSD